MIDGTLCLTLVETYCDIRTRASIKCADKNMSEYIILLALKHLEDVLFQSAIFWRWKEYFMGLKKRRRNSWHRRLHNDETPILVC